MHGWPFIFAGSDVIRSKSAIVLTFQGQIVVSALLYALLGGLEGRLRRTSAFVWWATFAFFATEER
jgi:hypothetical protein